MNNIQKNFKQKGKRGLCMAAGGILDPEREQFRFDQAQELKQSALAAGNAQIGSVMDTRGLSKRQQSDAVSGIRGVMSGLGAVGDNPTITGLSKRQQVNDSITDFTSGLRAQAVNAAATPFQAPVVPTSAPTVNFDDNGWKRSTPSAMFADGGVVGADGLTDAQRAKLSGARASLGVSNAAPAPAPTPAAAPAPVQAAPAPTQQPSIGGAINSIRERQRQLSNLANGGILDNAAEYWENDNARFEKTNPSFAARVVRGLNPMTGFGSAMGAMRRAASEGDVPGMAMATFQGLPVGGVTRSVPAAGLAKAMRTPSIRNTALGAVAGGVTNAVADEYQKPALANGGVVGAKTFEFEGKGTGTSDDIPVKVAGNHINVSKGEKAVILPAKTAQNPQALDMIEDVIEQTNGKPPNRGLRGNFNLGGFVDDYGDLRQPNRFQKAVPNEILRQQVSNAAPGAQRSLPFMQDGVRMGGAQPAAPETYRPNWVNPKTQVVPYQGGGSGIPPRQPYVPNWAPPNGPRISSSTALVPVQPTTVHAVPPTVAPKTPTSTLTKLGRAATIAGVVGNGIDMATSDIPAEQVAAGIRGASMANPLLGTAVNVGDALVNKATGGKYNMATGLDAAAKWASENVPGMRGDYMLPPEFQPGGTGKAAPAAPAEAPTAEEQATNRAALLPAAAQTSTPANFVPEAVASATPKLDAEVTRRGLSGLKTIGTVNGDVTTGRDKNGQLHVMAGLDNTDAQNEALRAKEADRMTKDLARQVQVFDGLRAERLQRSNDPAERAMGLAQAQQQILQQQNRNAAAHNDATAADAKEGRSIQRAALEQQNDQFSKTLAANAATAKAAAADAGIKDFDKLVEDSGLPKDEQTPFRDWFRGNYAGRKQKGADGKEVDVPGFEDMSADEKRAHMTNALAQYALVKQLRATEMNGNESMMPPANLTKRDIEWGDVKRYANGLPVINSGDPNHPGLLGDRGYLARAWLPKWVGGPSDQVMEEKDPKTGKTIRKWLAENTKGNMGPWGNMDTAAYMEGLQAKK